MDADTDGQNTPCFVAVREGTNLIDAVGCGPDPTILGRDETAAREALAAGEKPKPEPAVESPAAESATELPTPKTLATKEPAAEPQPYNYDELLKCKETAPSPRFGGFVHTAAAAGGNHQQIANHGAGKVCIRHTMRQY